MSLLNMTWFRVANDIVHDLSAGAWPGAALALWLARRGIENTDSPEILTEATRAWSNVFIVMLVALGVLILTGIFRLNYRHLGLSSAALKARTRIALIKHSVFVSVFIAATLVAFAAVGT